MKYVVSVSGGVGSALALHRTIQKYGKDNTVALFADTGSEAPDLYLFLDKIEAAWGVPIVRLNDHGGDIWDLFHAKNLIKTPKGGACMASIELKIKPSAKYILEHFKPDEATIVTGLSWMEGPEHSHSGKSDRQTRYAKRWHPYQMECILNDAPRLSRCEELAEIERLGITLPDAYMRGYEHNNCGGTCILAGLKQWAGVYQDYPERYLYAESRETPFYEKHGFAVLRDQSGGEVKPITLKEFRSRLDAGHTYPDSWRSTCNCMGLEGEQQNIFDLLECD
jgi:hypothetical protein